MDPTDVIINLRGLNDINVSDDGSQISFGGGIINDEFIQAAYDNGLEVRKYIRLHICSPLVELA